MSNKIIVDCDGDLASTVYFAYGHHDEPAMRAAVQQYIEHEQHEGCRNPNATAQLRYLTAYWFLDSMVIDGETELIRRELQHPEPRYQPVTILRDY